MAANINDSDYDDDFTLIEIDICIGHAQIRSCLDYVCECNDTTLSLENQNGPEGGLTLKIVDNETVSIETNGDYGSFTTQLKVTEIEMQALRNDLNRISQLKESDPYFSIERVQPPARFGMMG